MVSRQHYSKAPITEAIIDVRTRLPETIGLGDLERLHGAIKVDYPKKGSRNLVEGQFKAQKAGVSASAKSKSVGFLFQSEDQKQIVQMRLDGYTMSRLAPYDRWEAFRDEARRLWMIYRKTAKPEEVLRLAVRYINRIDIPLPFRDLKDYLRTGPEVAPGLPQVLTGLFMQLTIPQNDIRCTAMLTEALIEPATEGVASIVLDIDLFRTDDVPQSDDAVWEFFETLHERKNEIFEECITENTRELIR